MLELVVIGAIIILSQTMLSVGMPFHIGLYVGLVSFLVSFKISYRMGTLLGYFVFILYVGSLLILFGYTLCLFPNQRFSQEYVLGPGIFFRCMVYRVLSAIIERGVHEYHSGGISGYAGNFFVSVPGSLGYIFIGAYLFYILVLTTRFCNKNHEPLRIWFTKRWKYINVPRRCR